LTVEVGDSEENNAI